MKLTFHKEYEDYADKVNWLPRFEELKTIFSGLSSTQIASLGNDALLDTMEDVEELMRYYAATQNAAGLEPVMRKFYEMLQQCKARNIRGVEVLYLEMLFLRIDGMLYRGNGQYRQSAQGYDRCLSVARQCFEALKNSALDKEQRFFVGWSCVECFKEASEAHDLSMDVPGAVKILHEVIPLLQWLEKDLTEMPGICDQASELYANAGGAFYQYGDPAGGNSCYLSACDLLRALDIVHGSDFYLARAIWLRSVHGLMALMAAGDPKIMLQCEQEAVEFLRQRPAASLRDRTIVEAAKAVVLIQRSLAFQQNGKLEDAIKMAKDGVAELGACLDVLKEDYEGRHDYYRSVLEKIAGRIYNSYVGAMETLGVMYFQNDDEVAAEMTLKDVLSELTESGGLRMAGSGAALIQAETLQYLGIIATGEGDAYQADFYGTQAADLALSLGEETGNPAAWGVAAISCSLVAEVALDMKNKPKAGTYADKGLAACDALERIAPGSPQLSMRSNLVKFKKKASRRFF